MTHARILRRECQPTPVREPAQSSARHALAWCAVNVTAANSPGIEMKYSPIVILLLVTGCYDPAEFFPQLTCDCSNADGGVQQIGYFDPRYRCAKEDDPRQACTEIFRDLPADAATIGGCAAVRSSCVCAAVSNPDCRGDDG
jgi:hypothetical protein